MMTRAGVWKSAHMLPTPALLPGGPEVPLCARVGGHHCMTDSWIAESEDLSITALRKDIINCLSLQAVLGMDILSQAKSGMGKTAVFVLATLQQIEPVDGQVATHSKYVDFMESEEMLHVVQP